MNFQEKYLQNKIQTAAPEVLVAMMYEGAIKFLKVAKEALLAKDLAKVNTHIIRTQNIVYELAFSLDKKRGGEIARNLEAIYVYINDRLVQANSKKDVRLIDECVELLSALSLAWQEAIVASKSKQKVGASVVG
ncbi:MAG TPA: flagellar export chaperone FliS [Actinobacteria bacterium]|nr:flagellar export chaperone FliS [Actinomycetota bacterium]